MAVTIVPVQTRICANPRCRRVGIGLPSSEFNKNRRTCKACDRKRARDHRGKAWAKRRRVINRYLGKRCSICGERREKLLRCHETYGESHPKLLDTSLEDVKANCKNGRFARVCARCHGKAHALMGKGIVSWDAIQLHIKGFLQTGPPFENDAHLRAWHKYSRDKIRVKQLPLPMDIEDEPIKESAEPYVYRGVPRIEIILTEDDEEDSKSWEETRPDW